MITLPRVQEWLAADGGEVPSCPACKKSPLTIYPAPWGLGPQWSCKGCGWKGDGGEYNDPPIYEVHFHWSARTLRMTRIPHENNADFGPPEESDILAVDSMRCIVARPPYGDLIVKLLEENYKNGGK